MDSFNPLFKNRKRIIDELKKHYRKNPVQKEKIKEFQYSYRPDKAMKWYTRDCFRHHLVNKVLRLRDMDQINIFRPYIKDLCTQLQYLHEQNRSDQSLIVYRGYRDMNLKYFDIMKINIGSLISFNGFLSTTTDYKVALIFAAFSSNLNKVVLFEIRTNYNSTNIFFADISHLSHLQHEQELCTNIW
ncbi:hypothetical protein I4U23_008719 [Adineta vaga]|nr:hypothetical protein I4U23_008719 [Adineta vaga]